MDSIINALNRSSHLKYKYSESIVYERNSIAVSGEAVYVSLTHSNVGNPLHNPIHWLRIGKINIISDDELGDGLLLVRNVGNTKEYFVINSVDGKKYITIKRL